MESCQPVFKTNVTLNVIIILFIDFSHIYINNIELNMFRASEHEIIIHVSIFICLTSRTC